MNAVAVVLRCGKHDVFNKTKEKGADMFLTVAMYPLDAIPAIDAENHVYDTTIDAWICHVDHLLL